MIVLQRVEGGRICPYPYLTSSVLGQRRPHQLPMCCDCWRPIAICDSDAVSETTVADAVA